MTTTLAQGSLRERVAEEVRALMARRKVSGTQLAKAMNVSHTYMWRRLSGATAFDLDDLERIGALLGVPASAFFSSPPNQVSGGITGLQPLGLMGGSIKPVSKAPRSPERVTHLRVAA